jgi:hypothetical protein
VKTLSGIHHLLVQSLNHLPWVILGTLFWVVAYVQLYCMKPDTIGEVVTLVFSVLPVGAAGVSFTVTVARWGGKTTWVAVVFLLFGIVSLGCFLRMYLGESNVRKLLKDRKVFSNSPPKTAGLILQLLLGAISVLASVTLLVSGGWELIQGSVRIGFILALIGAVTLFFDRWPKHRWNLFERSYSALTE